MDNKPKNILEPDRKLQVINDKQVNKSDVGFPFVIGTEEERKPKNNKGVNNNG